MRLLGELFHDPDLPVDGKTYIRRAVRAILLEDTHLWMVYSDVNGDYKFPGGGVERNEKLADALIREVREETGLEGIVSSGSFGRMIEYRKPYEPCFEIFKMTSYYYFCRRTTRSQILSLRLDDYEAELQFHPVWVEMDEAISKNRQVLQETTVPRWTLRDTLVMEKLRESINTRLVRSRIGNN